MTPALRTCCSGSRVPAPIRPVLAVLSRHLTNIDQQWANIGQHSPSLAKLGQHVVSILSTFGFGQLRASFGPKLAKAAQLISKSGQGCPNYVRIRPELAELGPNPRSRSTCCATLGQPCGETSELAGLVGDNLSCLRGEQLFANFRVIAAALPLSASAWPPVSQAKLRGRGRVPHRAEQRHLHHGVEPHRRRRPLGV